MADPFGGFTNGVWNQKIDDFTDIPIIGPWVGRTGHVIDILSTPCDPTPTVVVTAFFYSLPRLAIALFKPDTNDLVTERWGGGHHKKRKKKMRILDMLNPETPVPKNKISSAIFKLGTWAERVGWWMMVIDATTDFLVHWTSTVYEWSGCHVAGTPYARSNGGEGTYGSAGPHRSRVGGWIKEHQFIFGAGSDSVDSPPGYQTSVGVALILGQPGFDLPFISGASVELIDAATDTLLATTSPPPTSDGYIVNSITFKDFASNLPAHRYECWLSSEGGYFTWQNSSFWLYGSKDRGILPDP